MIQETHIKETGLHELTSSDGKKVCLYNSGNGAKSIQIAEIITTENTKVTFNLVSERICIITTNTSENIRCHLISAYAPTLENTVRNPDETRIFYEHLSSLINSIKQRDALITGGDFNAKTLIASVGDRKSTCSGKIRKKQCELKWKFTH